MHPPSPDSDDLPPLPAEFFQADTITVARNLLGCILVVQHSPQDTRAGMIVETEAYCGPEDLCAHTARGRLSDRNRAMHGPPGHAYIYRIYGIHLCFNVVTAVTGTPHAVLIRALQPLLGIDEMVDALGQENRGSHTLCRGPGLLCKALGISMAMYGDSLMDQSGLWLSPAPPTQELPQPIALSRRINVTGGEPWVSMPWRFYFSGHPCVSGPAALRK
jgi:DNA-3-methyladenine glycosylase